MNTSKIDALDALDAALERIKHNAADLAAACATYLRHTAPPPVDPADIGTADETEQNRILSRM